jgi:hypothetical protein
VHTQPSDLPEFNNPNSTVGYFNLDMHFRWIDETFIQFDGEKFLKIVLLGRKKLNRVEK